MRVFLVGLTLFASNFSFANTVDGIETRLNQEVCGKNLPSISKAFEMPETYGMHSFVHMTKFQKSTQLILKAISDIHKIEVDALLKENDMQKADLAQESRKELHSYVESMLGEVKAKDRYKGLESLCSYLNH